MKNILITTALFFVTICSYAQENNSWLFGTNKDSARIMADEIMKNFRGAYKFQTDTIRQIQGANYYIIDFKSESFKSEEGLPAEYSIVYTVYNIGENKALEIAGTERFYIESIEGKFLDLFPIWQTYIDNTADKQKLASDKILYEKKDIQHPTDKKKYVSCTFRTDLTTGNEYQITFVR